MTICGRRENLLTDAVAEIRQVVNAAKSGGSVVQTLSLTSPTRMRCKRVVDLALEATGQLDGCVANAGGGGGMGPYHLQNTAEFIRVLHLNVLGTLFFVKHTIPHMVAAGGGSFVGMSSIAGHQTHPYFGAYTVSKAGIEQMMRNAADEYGPVKVRFNAIRPGFISPRSWKAFPATARSTTATSRTRRCKTSASPKTSRPWRAS